MDRNFSFTTCSSEFYLAVIGCIGASDPPWFPPGSPVITCLLQDFQPTSGLYTDNKQKLLLPLKLVSSSPFFQHTFLPHKTSYFLLPAGEEGVTRERHQPKLPFHLSEPAAPGANPAKPRVYPNHDIPSVLSRNLQILWQDNKTRLSDITSHESLLLKVMSYV